MSSSLEDEVLADDAEDDAVEDEEYEVEDFDNLLLNDPQLLTSVSSGAVSISTASSCSDDNASVVDSFSRAFYQAKHELDPVQEASMDPLGRQSRAQYSYVVVFRAEIKEWLFAKILSTQRSDNTYCCKDLDTGINFYTSLPSQLFYIPKQEFRGLIDGVSFPPDDSWISLKPSRVVKRSGPHPTDPALKGDNITSISLSVVARPASFLGVATTITATATTTPATTVTTNAVHMTVSIANHLHTAREELFVMQQGNRLQSLDPTELGSLGKVFSENDLEYAKFSRDNPEFVKRLELAEKRGLAAREAGVHPPYTTRLVIDMFGIDMTVRKLSCLRPKVWLNDEVINFFMSMLQVRSDAKVLAWNSENELPMRKSHFFTTFFIAKINEGGKYDYGKVQRWTKKFDIFSLDKIFMPVNVGHVHWTLMVIFMRIKEIHYYNSMIGSSVPYTGIAMKWLEDEGKKKDTTNAVVFDIKEWKIVDRFDSKMMKVICDRLGAGPEYVEQQQQRSGTSTYVPRQNNGTDCGVCVCLNADFTDQNIPLVGIYTDENLGLLRQKIGTDILRGTLN